MTANYDFQGLSPTDFEQLARDLLKKELRKSFQIFKEGKDQGIDLLSQKSDNAYNLVVQCKRYEPKAFDRLKRDIQTKELPKIKKLSPKRYILFTSVKLSLANKKSLLDILKPYCKNTADIYGAADINGLLDDFPEVQESNFKLWLTSTVVLQKVLNANISNFSDHGIEYITKHHSRFVANKSVPKAIKILQDHHYCIIAGKPGIGKTTLAHVLLSQYIADGYEMVSISHDIEDAWKAYSRGKKKIFYYDDFLGQTNLQDKLQKNEDDRLIKFIELISSTKESFFILTTREYILNQAALTYEKIGKKAKKLQKSIIELEDYTRLNKAEILCNHILFSSLDTDRKIQLLEPDIYWKILNHQNYYPRLIEDITDRDFLDSYIDEKTEYSQAALNYFDNPSAIWERAFRSLSTKAQTLLLILTTFPEVSYYDDVEKAFNETYSYLSQKKQWSQGLNDFKDALAELDGSPVKITKLNLTSFTNTKQVPKEGTSIEFENPSIRDFLENFLLQNGEIVKNLFHSSTFFEQIYYFLNLKIGKEQKNLLPFFSSLQEEVFNKSYSFIKEDSSYSPIKNFHSPTVNKTIYYVDASLCPAAKMARIIRIFSSNAFIPITLLKDRCINFLENITSYKTTLSGLVKLGDEIKLLNNILIDPIKIQESQIRSLILSQAEDLDDYYEASEYLLEENSSNNEIKSKLSHVIEQETQHALNDSSISASHLSDIKDKISHFASLHKLDYDTIKDQIDDKIKNILSLEQEEDDEHISDHQDYDSYISSISETDNEVARRFSELKDLLIE